MMMAFLRSSDTDPTKVLLLLLVNSGDGTETTHQYLYSWDTCLPLKTIKPMACSGRQLQESRLPSMLIPSTRPYSFVVVMETGVSYYENVHSTDTKRIHCPFIDKTAGSLEWVQWAKPRRHDEYLEKRDDLVIAREDGLLQYFQIEKASSAKFNMNWTIGHLGFTIDSAFCMLPGPPGKGGDIIIAGGSMTDGGVFHVSARGSPERTQIIESICPVRDMVLGPLIPNQSNPTPQAAWHETSDRIYVCCARGQGRSEISEIRYGLEAQIGWTMTYPDAAFLDRIWTLEIPHQNELLVLGSQSTQTTMVVFDLETQELSFTNSESHSGFDFEHPTLAAAVLDQGTVIQITTSSMNIIPPEPDAALSKPVRVQSPCHVAAIFEEDGIIATVPKSSSTSEIRLSAILPSQNAGVRLAPGGVTNVVDTPNALCWLKMQNTRLLVVGTGSAQLLGYLVSPNLSLKLAFQYEVKDLNSGLENSPVTSLAALSQSPNHPSLLLCGLRYGVLLCLELKMSLEDNSRLSMGNTTLIYHVR